MALLWQFDSYHRQPHDLEVVGSNPAPAIDNINALELSVTTADPDMSRTDVRRFRVYRRRFVVDYSFASIPTLIWATRRPPPSQYDLHTTTREFFPSPRSLQGPGLPTDPAGALLLPHSPRATMTLASRKTAIRGEFLTRPPSPSVQVRPAIVRGCAS